MRFKHFKPSNLTEQQLDELRMSPSSLRQFADSPEAKGIMAGFEAELVFSGLGEPDYDNYDMEPDYDADERAYNIQQVIEFFENDEYGYGIYGRDLDKLQNGLDEMYWEWQDEQMYSAWRDDREELIKDAWLEERPWLERLHDALVEGVGVSDDEADRIAEFGEARKNGTLGKPGSEYTEEELDMLSDYNDAARIADDILDEDVQTSIDKEDKIYDNALDEFRDNFYVDDDSGFFSDVGLRYMSDVAEHFDLNWPVMTGTGTGEGGFSADNAERLADDLHEKLGVKTKVSGGYHSAKRDNETWIFEPDSSLDADDEDNMPVEIVSPPMPLEECLTKMEQFFEWAEDNGAYANSSTGFHMGVSLPYRGGDVDYVKLALFLGDEHVLESFGRSSNTYTEAAIKKIRNRVKGNKEAVGNALELMKNNLIELAQKALEINNHGFGKYTSINPQGGNDSTRPDKKRGAKYIEFRSAGGSNYFEDIDKLKNTLLRYAQAMTIAANPAAERREYYKKLYKLISPPEGDPAIDLFSRFATGEISSDALKKAWAEKALEKDAPELTQKGDWAVVDTTTGKVVQGQTYNGYTRDEVRAKAKERLSPGSSDEGFDRAYSIEPQNTGRWEIYSFDAYDDRPETEQTLEIVDAPNRGAAADLVYDKYNDQKIAFKVRPYYGGEKKPEPKLSRRAELAKRIKAPKPNWNVVYRPTGRVIDTIINVSREEAQKLLPKVAQQHQFNSIDDLELHNQTDTERGQTAADRDRASDWEAYRTETGTKIDTLSHADADQAEAWRQDIVRRYSHPDSSVAVRRVGEEPQQTYSSYADAQRAADQQNQQSNNPNPTIQEPNQVRMSNGVPVWEVVDRETGSVVNLITDHTMREAHSSAMTWLRNIGAEDPATYSERFIVRPKMLQAGERNQSPTIPDLQPNVAQNFEQPNYAIYMRRYPSSPLQKFHANSEEEAREKLQQYIQQTGNSPMEYFVGPLATNEGIAGRVFEAFDNYFESVITPAKKRLK